MYPGYCILVTGTPYSAITLTFRVPQSATLSKGIFYYHSTYIRTRVLSNSYSDAKLRSRVVTEYGVIVSSDLSESKKSPRSWWDRTSSSRSYSPLTSPLVKHDQNSYHISSINRQPKRISSLKSSIRSLATERTPLCSCSTSMTES